MKYSHQVGSVLVYKRAESHSVLEGGRHVGDGHISVTITLQFTPLLQSLDGSHAPSDTLLSRYKVCNRRRLSVEESEEREVQTNVCVQALSVKCGAAAASCFLLHLNDSQRDELLTVSALITLIDPDC